MTDVPPPPAVDRPAESWLGERRARLPSAVWTILQQSRELGFLGRAPVEDQVDHALGFAWSAEYALRRPPRAFVDLGTGGGLPGAVLAATWPLSQAVLLDGSRRRTESLRSSLKTETELANVEVVEGRAEDLGKDPRLRFGFELVCARSFGPPAATAECATAFLGIGGFLVVSQPPDAQETGGPERWPAAPLSVLGLRDAGPTRFSDRFGYRVLEKESNADSRYPRRTGVPARRPLF